MECPRPWTCPGRRRDAGLPRVGFRAVASCAPDRGGARGPDSKPGQQAGTGDTWWSLMWWKAALAASAILAVHAQKADHRRQRHPLRAPGLPSARSRGKNARFTPPAFARALPRRLTDPRSPGHQSSACYGAPACRQGPWSQDRPSNLLPQPGPSAPAFPHSMGRIGRPAAPRTGPPSRRQSAHL